MDNAPTIQLFDVKNVLMEVIDAEMWKNFICHTKREEVEIWQIDSIIDDVLAADISNLTLTFTRDTLSDSESDLG